MQVDNYNNSTGAIPMFTLLDILAMEERVPYLVALNFQGIASKLGLHLKLC